jgi:sugar/nucleoside kinase (ribokinase family)
VFETYTPRLPASYQKSEFVLLANIAPGLQHHVLDQMRRPKLVVADTMDLWLNIALPELLKLLPRVDGFVLNESEARQLTQEDNLLRAAKKIHRLGPKFVIIKKGEHGAMLSSRAGLFLSPAFPLEKVVDPTGAGDSFVGGMMGYLSSAKGPIDSNLRKAMIYGSIVASYCCEGFGVMATNRATRGGIEKRRRTLEELIRF